MERQSAKPTGLETPKPLEFMVESYNVRCTLQGGRICVNAYSDISPKSFEGIVEESSLKEHERYNFEDLSAVYSMLEECLLDKRKIRLSDAGELSFPYFFQASKKHSVEKVF